MAEPSDTPKSADETENFSNVEANSEFETTPDLVLITDPYGLFLRVSPSVKALLGYEPEEVEGRLAIDFIHPSDLAETREQMAASRESGKVRHFYCRYISKEAKPVELVWSGIWFPDKEEYVFLGRVPPKSGRLPFQHRLDVLDGFQIAKGLFALSLVLAWVLDFGNNSTSEIRRIIQYFDRGEIYWASLMSCYVVACLLCLAWKQRMFQFAISIVSVVIWIWMGFVTLASPHYVAAAGIYEIMLGLGSIGVLYHRGRQL